MSLDQLPLELLLEVASHMDVHSLLSLERTSRRYRDAGPRLRRQLRVLRVDGRYYSMTDFRKLLELLPQLENLRELHVKTSRGWYTRWLLETLVSHSHHWQKVETLYVHIYDDEVMVTGLLARLCENCPRLTDVTLTGPLRDRDVERIVAALPAVRTFCVNTSTRFDGSFLSQLPVDLRHLSVVCITLRSEAVTELRRYGEMRTLKLLCRPETVQPAHLAAGLSGCGRLRSLTVDPSVLSSECLLHLPELRHLDVSSSMTGTDLDRLSALPPSLESLTLRVRSSRMLEDLERHLPSLRVRSLQLLGVDADCSSMLARLRSQSLRQLYVSFYRSCDSSFLADFPEDLSQVVNNCGSLDTLTLCRGRHEERIVCDSGARQQGLFEKIQAAVCLLGS